LRFNYSANESATALLRSPDGAVVARGTLSTTRSVARLPMSAAPTGNYTLLVRRGNETLATRDLRLDGGGTTIRGVTDAWSGGTLERVTLTVDNSRAVPVRLRNATIESANGTVGAVSLDTWIAANNATRVTVYPRGDELERDDAGTVRATVTVRTTDGSASGTFGKAFDGSNITVSETATTWNANALERATVRVDNTGDLPSAVSVELHRDGTELGSTLTRQVPANGSTAFVLSGSPTLYEAASNGTVAFDVIATGSTERVRTRITPEVAGANVSLSSVSTAWTAGRLRNVSYTVRNTGDLAQEVTVDIDANGTDLGTETRTVAPGTTSTYTYDGEAYTDSVYVAESAGRYPVTVTITGEKTRSRSNTTRFDGAVTNVTDVDASFTEDFDGGDDYELSTVEFTARNEGDLAFTYDSVAVEIDGENRTESVSSATTLDPGADATEDVRFYRAFPVSEGTHTLTIRLEHDGEVVATTTRTVTVGS
jgi:hypothetical protein